MSVAAMPFRLMQSSARTRTMLNRAAPHRRTAPQLPPLFGAGCCMSDLLHQVGHCREIQRSKRCRPNFGRIPTAAAAPFVDQKRLARRWNTACKGCVSYPYPIEFTTVPRLANGVVAQEIAPDFLSIYKRIADRARLDSDQPVAKAGPGLGCERKCRCCLGFSSDSHVFEPPDLWQTRIDTAFRDRAPRIERIPAATRS